MPVQVLNRAARTAAYRQVLAGVRQSQAARGLDPDDPEVLAGRCLEFAAQGWWALRQTPGMPHVVLQAGSASWPRRPCHERDADDYQFSYMWEPDHPVTRRALGLQFGQHKHGVVLPEMHVWLGCPTTGEVIDFTTGLWPAACRMTLGKDWPGPVPPEFFWDFRVPEGVVYRPVREATALAVVLVLKSIKERT